MPTATLTTKGRVTLPKVIRERLGVESGDRVVFRVTEDGEVFLEAATVDLRELRGALKWEGPPVTVEVMEAAVGQAGTRL